MSAARTDPLADVPQSNVRKGPPAMLIAMILLSVALAAVGGGVA